MRQAAPAKPDRKTSVPKRILLNSMLLVGATEFARISVNFGSGGRPCWRSDQPRFAWMSLPIGRDCFGVRYAARRMRISFCAGERRRSFARRRFSTLTASKGSDRHNGSAGPFTWQWTAASLGTPALLGVHLNLAYQWFCRLGLEGEVPDYSTFLKNRHGRFHDCDLLRKLFETTCGAVWLKGLSVVTASRLTPA